MKIEIKPERVKESTWSESLMRFAFGGVITVLTGVIDKKFGPSVAGLFLAFPAILPASITLVQSHKQKRDGERLREAKDEAGEDSLGAAFGALGLAVFGVLMLLLGAQLAIPVSLSLAFLAWAIVGGTTWYAFEVLSGRAEKGKRKKPASQKAAPRRKGIQEPSQ